MRIVIALGGNALGKNPEEQLSLVKETAKTIVDLVEEGHNIIVTHGNGPQVGMINLAMDFSSEKGAGTPKMPFAECGAMSQGYIGYHLQQAIQNELTTRSIDKECVTVVTQVLVDKKDKAFKNPTKPVGMFYSKEEAEKINKENGYTMKEDSGRGYRRVVPSPFPKEIIELETIEKLVENGKIVITCGGGGIPVVKARKNYKGVDAVIDKDNSSSRLAIDLGADLLMILTAVDKVSINFNKENQEELKEMSIEDAKKYIKEEQFAKGSMLPKIEASVKFVEETGNNAVITSLLKAREALNGDDGTMIYSDNKTKKSVQKNIISTMMILMFITIFLGFITHFIPKSNNSFVNVATLSDILISPILGLENILSFNLFLLVLGAFINLLVKIGFFNNFKNIATKFENKKLIFTTITMFLFSIIGLFNLFNEVIFLLIPIIIIFSLLKIDTIISFATMILGLLSGLLGRGIFEVISNPLIMDMNINHSLVILLSVIMWLGSLIISLCFVLRYEEKLLKKKDKKVNNLVDNEYINEMVSNNKYNKVNIVLVILTFIILLLSVIPWNSFGINIFNNWSSFLTGEVFGNWNYFDLSLFLEIMFIILTLINGFREDDIVDTFVKGSSKWLNVVILTSFASGIVALISITNLDNYFIDLLINCLEKTSIIFFTLIVSLMNVINSLANNDYLDLFRILTNFDISKEIMLITTIGVDGIVKVIMPTSLMLIAGLSINKIEYVSWVKWCFKIVGTIFIFLVLFMTILSVVL